MMLSLSSKTLLRSIYENIIVSVKPKQLINSQLKVSDKTLIINEEQFPLNHNCYVVGFGKAVLDMGLGVHDILQNHIRRAIFSVPIGSTNVREHKYFLNLPNISVFEGAKDNISDEESCRATREILVLVDSLTADDLLVVLISGGGSALLVSPADGISLNDKISVTKLLARAGADIIDLNVVRQGLSKVKGGKLAMRAYPARVISLILSDIIGDPLEYIASGPTVPPGGGSPLEVLKKYRIDAPSTVFKVLSNPKPLIKPEIFHRMQSFIIGNNEVGLKAGKSYIERSHGAACILTTKLQGLVQNVAESLSHLITQSCLFSLKKCTESQFRSNLEDSLRALNISEESFSHCVSVLSRRGTDKFLLLGGETTVLVKGKGLGGRNMELALRLSGCLSSLTNLNIEVGVLCGATDGIDGPTDAAGAFSYPGQVHLANTQGMNVSEFLDTNDSYNFFKTFNSGEDLLQPGHTGTNVMDVVIIKISETVKNDKSV